MPSTQYDIRHTTIYRYNEPVSFGLHRVMFRPRDSHDLRVLATDLQVSPAAHTRLIQDPHSNSVALVQPMGEATELRIVCSFTIETVPAAAQDQLAIDPAGPSPIRCRTGSTSSTTCARTTTTPTAR